MISRELETDYVGRCHSSGIWDDVVSVQLSLFIGLTGPGVLIS